MALVIASGYPSPYRNVSEELAASKANNWYPTTIDFRATAAQSGGAEGAASFEELLNVLAKKTPRSLTDLGLVGHANPEALVLAGQVDRGTITTNSKSIISADSIKVNLNKIKSVRNRFKTDDKNNPASIIIYACDAGSGDELLEALSDAFQVTAKGFKQEIWWCFMTTSGPVVRGRTWYDAVGTGVPPDCGSANFSPDIRVWKPDKQKVP
jgi:hypothetical protein